MENQAPTSWSEEWGKIIYPRVPPGPNPLRRAVSPTYVPRLDGSPSPVSEKGQSNRSTSQFVRTKKSEEPEKIRHVSKRRLYETPYKKYGHRKFFKTEVPTRKPACTNIDVITSIMTLLQQLKLNLADLENDLKDLNFINMKLRKRIYHLEREKSEKRTGRRF